MGSDRLGTSDPVVGNLGGMQTQEVRVRAFVRNGAVIEALYTASEDDAPRRSECVLLNVRDLVMLDVSPDQTSAPSVT